MIMTVLPQCVFLIPIRRLLWLCKHYFQHYQIWKSAILTHCRTHWTILIDWFSEKYRKSFPSASSSFASSSYREDSTDTDSSIRSPKLLHPDRAAEMEPHYQFRKSNSMKLALKEDHEGDWFIFVMLCQHSRRCLSFRISDLFCFSILCISGGRCFFSII